MDRRVDTDGAMSSDNDWLDLGDSEVLGAKDNAALTATGLTTATSYTTHHAAAPRRNMNDDTTSAALLRREPSPPPSLVNLTSANAAAPAAPASLSFRALDGNTSSFPSAAGGTQSAVALGLAAVPQSPAAAVTTASGGADEGEEDEGVEVEVYTPSARGSGNGSAEASALHSTRVLTLSASAAVVALVPAAAEEDEVPSTAANGPTAVAVADTETSPMETATVAEAGLASVSGRGIVAEEEQISPVDGALIHAPQRNATTAEERPAADTTSSGLRDHDGAIGATEEATEGGVSDLAETAAAAAVAAIIDDTFASPVADAASAASFPTSAPTSSSSSSSAPFSSSSSPTAATVPPPPPTLFATVCERALLVATLTGTFFAAAAPSVFSPQSAVVAVARGAAKGFHDSANVAAIIRFALRSEEVVSTLINCSVVNAIFIFSLYVIVDLTTPLQPTGAFSVVWETLFSLLWIAPMYAVTQLLGLAWYAELYALCKVIHVRERGGSSNGGKGAVSQQQQLLSPQQQRPAVSFVAVSELLIKFAVTLIFALIAAFVALLPSNFIAIFGINVPVGYLGSFVMQSLLHAFYCFDYRFMQQERREKIPSSSAPSSSSSSAIAGAVAAGAGAGTAGSASSVAYRVVPVELSAIIRHFEGRWPYYFGYGASHVLIQRAMELAGLPLLPRMAVCTTLFAVNVITTVGVEVRWEGDALVGRLPIFSPVFKGVEAWLRPPQPHRAVSQGSAVRVQRKTQY